MDSIKMDLDGRLKETINFQSEMLHYGLYTSGYKRVFQADIPWHWHDEFEFGTITGGSVAYQTSRRTITLHKGDGIFINSGVLHYLHPIEPFENARLQTQFFDRTFLAGAPGSLLDIRYVTPVQEMRQLDVIPFYRDDPESARFLDRMQEGVRLCLEKGEFFELRLRSLFSELWETIYRCAMQSRDASKGVRDVLEDGRIKQMILYIQKHFPEKLTVASIAASIPVSERECYRLFQSSIGVTPVEYLLSVRLQNACLMLMNTRKTVLDIALETGFGSSSYFGGVFYRNYHLTPVQYRKLSRSKAQVSKG